MSPERRYWPLRSADSRQGPRSTPELFRLSFPRRCAMSLMVPLDHPFGGWWGVVLLPSDGRVLPVDKNSNRSKNKAHCKSRGLQVFWQILALKEWLMLTHRLDGSQKPIGLRF